MLHCDGAPSSTILTSQYKSKGIDMARVTGTKRAILDAALQLASERGITGTTMDDVAVRAGVAKGSLYYNFASKDKLFEGLLLEGMSGLTEALRASREGTNGWTGIEALVTTLLSRIAANTALAKVIAADIFRTDRAWKETSFAFRHEALAEFAAAIDEALPEALPDGAATGATELMASSVFGATLMAGLEWLLAEPVRPQEDVVAAILLTFSGRLHPSAREL